MMDSYGRFAEVYDKLMSDVDYDRWVEYIEEVLVREEISPKNILELACGTGNVTNRLGKKGYNITGIDISSEMLAIAKNKSHDLGINVKYIKQDITELDFSKKVDCVICMCDGFNYIIDEEKLCNTFKKVYSVLNDNGIFIFDISSYYKLSNILGNNTFAENFDDVSYIWENYFDNIDNICELELTLFIKKGNLFERIKEVHYQKAYKIDEIKKYLFEAKFKNVNVYGDYTFNMYKNNDERNIFICKK